jgi:hypothetical protein
MAWNLVDKILENGGWDKLEEDMKKAVKMYPGDSYSLQKYYAKRCLDNKFLNNLQYVEYMNSLKKSV